MKRFSAKYWVLTVVGLLLVFATPYAFGAGHGEREDSHGAPPAAVETADEEHAEAGHGEADAAMDEHAGMEEHGEDHAAADAHGGGHGAEGGEHGGEHEGGHHEFPNWLELLLKKARDSGAIKLSDDTILSITNIAFAWIVAGLWILFFTSATKNRGIVPEGRKQTLAEMLVGGLNSFFGGIMGEELGKRFVPFVGTLFLYIWGMNLFGLIILQKSPTANLNTTLALALCTFCYVQYYALTANGVKNYVKHLMGEDIGIPGLNWILMGMNFFLHIIGELAKPVSLSLRLFGNVFGEDTLLYVFGGVLSVGIFIKTFVPIPLHLPFLFLAILTSTVQALVFSLLSSIYFVLMAPHDEHAEEHA